MEKKLALIRIRGETGLRGELKTTLSLLRLMRNNVCVIVPASAAYMGMVKKISNFTAWGEIDEETERLLKEKRGEKTKDAQGKSVLKPFFRLNPPKGGFERKGIKKPYSMGGALGYRGNAINELIKRMI